MKQKTKNLLDLASKEDLEKIKSHNAGVEGLIAIDSSWMLFAEFAVAFGWEAYKDARDNKIPASEMYSLVESNRRLEALKQYQMAESMFIGAGSVQTKKPFATFKRMTKHIINRIKVDQ